MAAYCAIMVLDLSNCTSKNLSSEHKAKPIKILLFNVIKAQPVPA